MTKRPTSYLSIAVALLAGSASIPAHGAGKCDAKRVQMFVGALGTPGIGKAAMKRSGSKTIRWIQPGTMVTMDYRVDRLNIRVDARNFLTGLDCG